MQLTAVYMQVPEGYIAFVEELPGANTQGDTLEEARENLREAVALVLEANRELAKKSLAGRQVTREAFELLKQLPLNFVGNVEGRDIYSGRVDVIVADGFVGNVALKTSEGVANLVRATLKETLAATITRQVGYLLSRSAFSDFKKRLDHTEYGGAPLLGVKGACFVTHGSSNVNAIKNAIRVASEFVERRITANIEKELAQISHPAAVEVHANE